MMKIVRFRARTVLAVAAVSLVCFIALMRTSFLLTSSNSEDNNDLHNNDDNVNGDLENINNLVKKPIMHHTDRESDSVISDRRKDKSDSVDEQEINEESAQTTTEGKAVLRKSKLKFGQKAGSLDRHAFHVVKDAKLPPKRQKPALGTLHKFEKNLPVASTIQPVIKLQVNKDFNVNNVLLNEINKYPALPADLKNNNNMNLDSNNLPPRQQIRPQQQLQKTAVNKFSQSIIPSYLKLDANGSPPKYPILTPDNKFIPPRRIVHLDLKGAAPRVEYFESFFELVANAGATGILLEYEDMFPFSGRLAAARAVNAYSDAQVRQILSWAARFKLEVIPLIQTFGHLEWILKHQGFAKYRELDKFSQVICLSNFEAVDLVKEAVDQVMRFHKGSGNFVHMGADEAFQVGLCEKCQQTMKTLDNSRDRLMIRHIANISSHIRKNHGKRVLMWHDMLMQVEGQAVKEYKLDQLVEPVIWAYAENLNEYLTSDTWFRFSNVFPNIWGASAFKGADGPSRFYSNIPHYLRNHLSWNEQMNREYSHFKEFSGLILTGWQRFDHFAILCEILPVGIPSLIVNLLTVNYGMYDREVLKLAAKAMQCKDDRFEIDSTYGGVGGRCDFPGSKVYELVQQFYYTLKNVQLNLYDDYKTHGWLSEFNMKHNYSSSWYLEQILGNIFQYKNEMNSLHADLKREMSKIFFNDTVDEFLFEYIDPEVKKLNEMEQKASAIMKIQYFPVRPFPIIKNEIGIDQSKEQQGGKAGKAEDNNNSNI